jgi:hypothetical protein
MEEKQKSSTTAKKTEKEVENLKQKLQEARMLLKEEELTKSGRNSFLGNNYFTLQDLQSPITRVCNKVGICPVITFEKDNAVMTIYDFDSEDTIITKTPMAEVVASNGDKKKSLMQELMSNESYARRALYIATFEIVEDDGETQGDDLERHSVLMVKTRIERTMTQLLQKGMDFDDVVKQIGLDEKKYNGFLNACNTINSIDNNLKVLLNKSKE